MGDIRPNIKHRVTDHEDSNDDSSSAHGVRQQQYRQQQQDREPRRRRPTVISAATGLLERQPWDYEAAHTGPCNHGTFSPRPTPRSARALDAPNAVEDEDVFGVGFGRLHDAGRRGGRRNGVMRRVLGDTIVDLPARVFGNRVGSRPRGPAGGARSKTTYPSYYLPLLAWIQQYRWSWLRGDIIAAFTMASFYLPMALSLAENLAHIPPINGLYSYVINTLVYALLGSSPQMVVGPEAAGSMLLGTIVRSNIESGQFSDDDDYNNARTAGVVTGLAGSFLLIAGVSRLGFLDNVLSRPFLRGFISAVGFVILVDQLIPELGLGPRAREIGGVMHSSSVAKIAFLIAEAGHTHRLTAIVSVTSFAVIMVCREIKKRLQPRFPGVAYVPDRFVIVVLSAVLTWRYRWDKHGLLILGDVSTGKAGMPFHWPFQRSHITFIEDSLSTAFLVAMLGFFESSVAAKALGGGDSAGTDGVQGVSLSANRELVALGVANVIGGCFMALPAFGGYGRSKVNISTGGKTSMSSVLLSCITIVCVLYLLPYFHYLPKAVLSAMISVVAWSLIEEAPHDIKFFYRLGGWGELALMFVIFTATIFYSLALGIATGVGVSLVMVIRHSTRSRIQILGRVPGTHDFENAEAALAADVEFIEGCLIVKIPEPLTFANTGDLKHRLQRLEKKHSARHDDGHGHGHGPAPRRGRDNLPPPHNQNVIFDVHGVTSIDGSGAQVLAGIVSAYRDRNVRVFFCRVPPERSRVFQRFLSSGIVDSCGGMRHFVVSVGQALRMSEVESFSVSSPPTGACSLPV